MGKDYINIEKVNVDFIESTQQYKVVFTDGIIIYYNKEDFEKDFVPIENDSLTDTILPMISKNYSERFKAEYKQLKIRIAKLQKMLNLWENNQLSFVPKCSRELLENQLNVMTNYLNILEQRMMIENINND